jgi:Double zinc ribbon/zinc-ribbon domain
MALCTSCGSQVEESASFCTSCGKPMPAAAHPSAAVSVARPVCSACGAQSNPDSLFCTECGKRLNTDPEPVAKSVQAVAADAPSTVEAAATSLLTAFCTNCGSKLESGTSFCTNCGQPVPAALTNTVEPATHVAPATPTLEATQPVILDPVSAAPASTKQAPTEPPVAMPASSRAESTPTAVTPLVEDQTEDRPAVAVPIQPAPVEPIRVEPVPQVAPPVYATPTDYPPAQPGGGAFRLIVLVLLLLIVTGGFGGWYFMGVETVIVCSPPDVTVFLDNKELAPTSYGRYVISHLSRRPHLLKVQSPGFADTIERLDFPTTSLHEWVNIKLVPHRPAQPSRR